jgi:hypothetical protein
MVTQITVRQLFIQALAMKPRRSWLEIKERLIRLGHDSGWSEITEVGRDCTYTLVFPGAGSISFDGSDYHYERAK